MDVYCCTKRELMEHCLALWRMYGRTYSTLISDYDDAIKELKKMKRNLRKVSREDMRDLPKIPFLELESMDEAKSFLSELDERGMRILTKSIENLRYNVAYNGMKAVIANARCKKSTNRPLSYTDPDSRNGSSNQYSRYGN